VLILNERDAQLLEPTPGCEVRVVVLMSTFNGERYVAEQLRSILDQLPERGRIFVRDDGSRDGTVAAIKALGDSRISLVSGPNIGFGKSFLTLLAAAPSDAEMVMFADQDDFWLPGKVDRAWQMLMPLGGEPGLYGSAQMLVDAELRPIHQTQPWPAGRFRASALTENIITGCTAALNRPAVRLLQRAGVPDEIHLHDWWVYLVISFFGTVVFDARPTLLYRQHGGNQIGHGSGPLGRIWGATRFVLRRDWVGMLLLQIRALLQRYGEDLPQAEREQIANNFELSDGVVRPKWTLVFSPRRWRSAYVFDVFFRVLLLAYILRLWPLPGRRLSGR